MCFDHFILFTVKIDTFLSLFKTVLLICMNAFPRTVNTLGPGQKCSNLRGFPQCIVGCKMGLVSSQQEDFTFGWKFPSVAMLYGFIL